jgi:uncharacterized protein YciI
MSPTPEHRTPRLPFLSYGGYNLVLWRWCGLRKYARTDGIQERFAMTQQKDSAHTKDQPGVQEQFVYFIRPSRDGFFEQPTEFEEKTVSEHAEYVKQLLEQGTVFLAGRCFDPPYYPESSKEAISLEMPTPGIVLFVAEDLEAAKKIMEADPAIRTGVFKARLNSFRKAFSEE